MDKLHDILSSLGLPETSRRIYIELINNGETPARQLAEKLSLTRPSTYDHLEILKKKGLVAEKQIDNKSYYVVDDVKQVERMLSASIDKLAEQKNTFENLLPSLLEQSKTIIPTIKFYGGKIGLTYLLNDVLWSGTKNIQTMWPHEHMVKVLDKDDMVRFNRRRIQEGIAVQALWPHNSKVTEDHIWSGQDDLVERRHAPKEMRWDMGYSIYGDKVSFISSEKETFGFIVNSQEFADLMRVQFETLWATSKKR